MKVMLMEKTDTLNVRWVKAVGYLNGYDNILKLYKSAGDKAPFESVDLTKFYFAVVEEV